MFSTSVMQKVVCAKTNTGDGILDSVEGVEDPDFDLIPSYLDVDSNGELGVNSCSKLST